MGKNRKIKSKKKDAKQDSYPENPKKWPAGDIVIIKPEAGITFAEFVKNLKEKVKSQEGNVATSDIKRENPEETAF